MWIYKDKEFVSEDIKEYFGFVYIITEIKTGKKYIGKKNFYSVRTDKKTSTEGKRKKKIRKESDWKNYYSSSDLLKALVKEKGKAEFKREILFLSTNLGELNYMETKYLFLHNVLETDEYFNSNIMGRYFAKNVQKYFMPSSSD